MIYAAQNLPPEDAVSICTSIGISKEIVIESVRDLEEFCKKLQA